MTSGGDPISEVDRLLASLPDAVIGVRPDLTVFLWNGAAEALTGRSATRALERHLSECLGPEARLIRHLGETVRLAEGRAEPESEVTATDGRSIPVSVLTAPIHGPRGQLRGAVAVLAGSLADPRARGRGAARRAALGARPDGTRARARDPESARGDPGRGPAPGGRARRRGPLPGARDGHAGGDRPRQPRDGGSAGPRAAADLHLRIREPPRAPGSRVPPRRAGRPGPRGPARAPLRPEPARPLGRRRPTHPGVPEPGPERRSRPCRAAAGSR